MAVLDALYRDIPSCLLKSEGYIDGVSGIPSTFLSAKKNLVSGVYNPLFLRRGTDHPPTAMGFKESAFFTAFSLITLQVVGGYELYADIVLPPDLFQPGI